MFPCNDMQPSTKRVRNHFSQEEDAQLLSLVSSFKKCEIDWDEISRIMKRNVRQCKDRYYNYLINTKQNIDFTNNELLRIIQLYSIIGPHWVKMSSFFEGRTDIDIKLAYKRLQRRKIATESSFQIYLSVNKDNQSALKKLCTKRFITRKASNKSSLEHDNAVLSKYGDVSHTNIQNSDEIEFILQEGPFIDEILNEEEFFNDFCEC